MTAQPIPEVQALLAQATVGEQPDPTAPLDEFRRQCDAGVLAMHHLVRDHGPLHDVRDLVVGEVAVRVYVPSGVPALPAHVHVHGGGWWMGSIKTSWLTALDAKTARRHDEVVALFARQHAFAVIA